MTAFLNNISIMKVIAVFLILIACFSCFIFTTNAKTDLSSSVLIAGDSASMDSFDVSKYLKIDDGQTYLDDSKDSPVKKEGALAYFIIKLITFLTYIIGSFALLFLITGGFTLMVSHGNSQMQTKGKQIILYSIVGLVVAFMSLIIVTFVQSLFFTV